MKILLTTCVAALAFLFAQPAAATTESHSIMLAVDSKLASVNGDVQLLENAPFISNGNTLVPLRFVSTAFSADIDWDQSTKTARISRGDLKIKITAAKLSASVNDYSVKLDTAAQLKGAQIFVPLRFVSYILGAKTEWNAKTRTIDITVQNYKHKQAGFSFLCPINLKMENENETTARFTGPQSRALVVEKTAQPSFSVNEMKSRFPNAKLLMQSEQELWIKKGNLIMLYKLLSKGKDYFIITYGIGADQFNSAGKNEFELVVSTLQNDG